MLDEEVSKASEQSVYDDTFRDYILEHVWDIEPQSIEQRSAFDDIRYVIQRYLQYCQFGGAARRCFGKVTHRDVCGFAKSMRTCVRHEVSLGLASQLQLDLTNLEYASDVEACLKFIADALFCLDIATWKPLETLYQFCDRTLMQEYANSTDTRLPRTFNAKNMTRQASLNVQWTDCLHDHLQLTGNDTDIRIFHVVSMLELYQRSRSKSILSEKFVKETQRTMSLLLPDEDVSAKKWLIKEVKLHNLDPATQNCAYLHVGDRFLARFYAWRDRLELVKQLYDEHEPQSLVQLWRDTRKPLQQLTFGIALVALILSLAACVEGALQVYKAYVPSPP